MNGQLVLDVFDGGRLLTRGFEAAGFTVVGGPEQIYGQDLAGWRPMAGRFDGVIGGPPCQVHSTASAFCATKAIDMIPDFCAIVTAAQPEWFVMENVPGAPVPVIDGYNSVSFLLNRLSLGVAKQRRRRFTFGVREHRAFDADAEMMAGLWRRAMADVLPRRLYATTWFPTHPLDPPAADCGPQLALLASDHIRSGEKRMDRRKRKSEGLSGWLKHELQPALLATDGKSHLKSATSERRASGVTGWWGGPLTVEIAWAAQELPGTPPELWTNALLYTKAGAIRLLGNGVPFDMASHVARAVSIAVVGKELNSVVRWPDHSLLKDHAA